ncbi:pyridoxamine 5'-phosphate oxidase family protein [Nocardia sp. NPDC051570]|uniref:pyridoxamine 5'-phosphate oxidase family protein n=1 Tax=Nocardia sp. NPDC051570 TaxID=3364324 RepID=UPI0037B4D928
MVDVKPIVPKFVYELWERQHCAVLTTVCHGRPHSSLMWYEPWPDHILLSTVIGRQKYKDVLENPNVSLLFHPDGEWDRYLELRGTAHFGGDGRAAIDRMYTHYRSKGTYPWDSAEDRRIEIIVDIRKSLSFIG